MFQQYLYHHPRTVSPSALLFPAVNPRRRFLIHNTVQEYFPGLNTVSVGEGEKRRTVVTLKEEKGDEKTAVTPKQKQNHQQHQQQEDQKAKQGAGGGGRAGSNPEGKLQKKEDRRDDANTKTAKLQHHQQCPQQKQSLPNQQQQQRQQNRSGQGVGGQQKSETQQHHQAEQRTQQGRGSQLHLNNAGSQQQQQRQQPQQQHQRQQQQNQGKSKQRPRKARSRSCHSEPRSGGRQRQPPVPKQRQQQGHGGHGAGPKHEEREVREDTPPEESQSKRRRNKRNRRQRERQEQQQAEGVNGRHEADDKNGRPPDRGGHKGGNHHANQHGGNSQVNHNEEHEWNNRVNEHVAESGGRHNRLKNHEETDKHRNHNNRGQGGQEGDLRLFLNSRRELLAQSSSGASPSKAFISNQENHRMPVTMTADDCSGNIRPRGKACAQIYRPPPARSSRIESGPVQQHQPYQHKQQHNQFYQHLQHSPQNNQYPPHNLVSNRQRTDSESSYATTSSDYPGKAGRERRPDQMLYVPRGRRGADTNSMRGTPTPMQDFDQCHRPPSPTFSVCSTVSEFSGRNRYSRVGSRQGSQLSIYEGDFDRIKSKPPISKGESASGNGRHKGGNRFNRETLQLIERCLNQDSESRHSDNQNWESDSVHSSPAKNNRGVRGRNQKSPTPTREFHSIHSKENVIHPVETNTRTRKGRRNRRRNSRSRESSIDKYNDSNGSPGFNNKNGDQYHSPHNERGFGSCERVFYNSNFSSSNERYDRGYDNYDRYSSINSSRASSRNSSRERTPQHAPYHNNWRGASSPASPAKSYQSRNSPGKPPSGRLGSLPNVALDYNEHTKRSPHQSGDENHRYYTLPVKHSKTPLLGSLHANSIDNSRLSDVPNSHQIEEQCHEDPVNTRLEDNDQESSLYNGANAEHRLENIKENPSFDNSYSSDQLVQGNNLEDMAVSGSEGTCDNLTNGIIIEATQNALQSEPTEDTSGNIQPLQSVDDDRMNVSVASEEQPNSTDGSPGKVYFDLGGDSEDLAEAYGKEPTAVENSVQNDMQIETKPETKEEEKEEKKNVKKFSFNWADEEEDSWDTLYDDTGECLDPQIKRQLSDSIGKVKLVKPANDYYDYQPKETHFNDEEYGHVIEIYDFPVSFKTQDLMMIFSPYQNNGFDIKWVDDTHALGIFATALIAKEALSIDHPFLKTRSLSLATETSRSKAMRITEALLPYKPRPATSASLARRLVSGALGLKVDIPREVREAERQKLKDAKAQKRLAAKQRSDAWEGTLT